MGKFYVKPCITVDCMLPEGDILGLSKLGMSSVVIEYADYDEKNPPCEADLNVQPKGLWNDEDDL
ncbi:MAG: hypothetical protein J5637_07200 [Prevotella sp.]|nr:hypothetical protein [Prevotella sp.]